MKNAILLIILSFSFLRAVEIERIRSVKIIDENIRKVKYYFVNKNLNYKNALYQVPGTIIDNRIILVDKNNKLLFYKINGKKCGSYPKDLETEASPINIGDTIIVIPNYTNNILYFYYLKSKRILYYGLPENIIITNVDIKDSILIISGRIADISWVKDTVLFVDGYLFASFYFGVDTAKWGIPISVGCPIPYKNIIMKREMLMHSGVAHLLDDGRLVVFDKWDGKIYEYSVDGKLLYKYSQLNLKYCHGFSLGLEFWKVYDTCVSFAKPSMLKAKNLLITYRNITNPPVICDFWDVGRRKFVDSLNIGSKAPFAYTDSSIWLVDSVSDKGVFLGEYKIIYSPPDSLENFAQIVLTDPIDLSRKNLTLYLANVKKDTVIVLNSYMEGPGSIGPVIEAYMKSRFDFKRIITVKDRLQCLTLKNMSKLFGENAANRIYSIDEDVLKFPYMIMANRDGKVLKTFDYEQAENFLRKEFGD